MPATPKGPPNTPKFRCFGAADAPPAGGPRARAREEFDLQRLADRLGKDGRSRGTGEATGEGFREGVKDTNRFSPHFARDIVFQVYSEMSESFFFLVQVFFL